MNLFRILDLVGATTIVLRRILLSVALFFWPLVIVRADDVAIPSELSSPAEQVDSIMGSIIVQNSSLVDADSSSKALHDSAASLKPFFAKLNRVRSGSEEVVSILHIGDSHVQPGFWDESFRRLIQQDFGNAGRGLIVPHKLSGSNENPGYTIRTKDRAVSQRAVAREVKEKLGFTGVAIGIPVVAPSVEILSDEPFSSVTVFHHGASPAFLEPDSLSLGFYCTIDNTERSTRVDLIREVQALTLSARIEEGFDNPTLYGFSLENGNPGVLVHSVGINGASFETFERNTDFTAGGAGILAPDLIVISLGTNNCFGTGYRSDVFRDIATKFIIAVRDEYPGAALLLTTPMEGGRVSGRRYVVNPNLADVARVLCEIARENGMACWNFYDAAGGDGANSEWFTKGLIHTDRLHLTEAGYARMGEMMYDAIHRGYDSLFDADSLRSVSESR